MILQNHFEPIFHLAEVPFHKSSSTNKIKTMSGESLIDVAGWLEGRSRARVKFARDVAAVKCVYWGRLKLVILASANDSDVAYSRSDIDAVEFKNRHNAH